jgi:hypothetical protein
LAKSLLERQELLPLVAPDWNRPVRTVKIVLEVQAGFAQSSKSSGELRKNWAPLTGLPPPMALPLGTGVGSACWRVGLPSNEQLRGASTAEANGL